MNYCSVSRSSRSIAAPSRRSRRHSETLRSSSCPHLFPIREMPSVYECGLLDVPSRPPRRLSGTAHVRSSSSRSCGDCPAVVATDTAPTNRTSRAVRTDPPTVPMIPIAPGVTAPLRGVQETLECIARDSYIPAQCLCCSQDLFCIMDACYLLCPTCKVVSALVGGADREYNGGVGLAFTVDDLQRIQYDIVQSRQR